LASILVAIRRDGFNPRKILKTSIHRKITRKGLDNCESRSKIPEIPRESIPALFDKGDASGFMSSKPFSQPQDSNPRPCKHPRVQIVSREEDAEFVECLECREIFESSELEDMSIEENVESDSQES
jgi:hypothetical protein